jgi:hypothetical protein
VWLGGFQLYVLASLTPDYEEKSFQRKGDKAGCIPHMSALRHAKPGTRPSKAHGFAPRLLNTNGNGPMGRCDHACAIVGVHLKSAVYSMAAM